MDELYDLPFTRVPHPMYTERIPGYETVKHSLVLMRGCFGGCTFCSITEHEGRVIQNRSAGERAARDPRAAPPWATSAGRSPTSAGRPRTCTGCACKSPEIESKCRRLSCVHPGVCENLETDHGPLIDLMQRVRKEDGVKHVFIASGVRYDLAERSPEYVEELARAPRRRAALGRARARQPARAREDEEAGHRELRALPADVRLRQQGRRQGAVRHPLLHQRPSRLDAGGHGGARALAQEERPAAAPGAGLHSHADGHGDAACTTRASTRSPCNRSTRPRACASKKLQKSLLLYWSPEQWPLAREALREAGRADLIGSGPGALVPA